MGNKILNIDDAVRMSQLLRKQNKTLVLTGGFFDILHPGHIKFLEESKKQGDCLFVLLEDDLKLRQIKGPLRPINSQQTRAAILSSLQSVNFVVLLKNMTNDKQYDKLVSQIAPNVIATTELDPYIIHKKRQAKLVNGKIVYVMKRISKYSTTKLAKLI